jgi:hypothetical protein
MILVGLFHTGTAAELGVLAFLIEADHVEGFSRVVASAGADGVVDFRRSLHFTKFYYNSD